MLEIVFALAITIALVNIFARIGKIEREQREENARFSRRTVHMIADIGKIDGKVRNVIEKVDAINQELEELETKCLKLVHDRRSRGGRTKK